MKQSKCLTLLLVTILLLPLAIFANNGITNNAFSITNSNSSEIKIQFSLPEWQINQIDNNGEIRKQIKVQDTSYLFIDEEETLPVFSTMIAIPNRGGVNLLVSNTAKSTINEFTADFNDVLRKESQQERYPDVLYPANNVVISEPQILRDFRVITLNIYPFQYNRNNRTLFISENLDITLTFDNRTTINELNSDVDVSCSFDSIYKGLILNYDSLIQTREVSYRNPVLLVIYGDYTDAIYQAKINEYVNWKKQRGFIVNAVSTSVTGTTNTSIKSYIQNAYNNVSTRPDYITLIGDTDGTIAVPSNNSYVDYQYTWLAGNDNLGDVMIGRISVNSTSDLDVIMAKIISLEKNINQHPTDWLNRMVLVGDSSSSGISTIYTNRYIRDISEEINPAYTYTEVYGSSPSNTTTNSAINQGVAFL
ncbi:MAG: Gingipain R1 precursor [Candidatus Cloacimonetes bacterium ADurb.Bin089]|nr:MAG: Gingipain R1 precursor [Candidatus Cloacimonetes bacterium ADurb.Bin089]